MAWLITTSTDFLRLRELGRLKLEPAPDQPLSALVYSGVRIGVGAAAAALIAHAFGWDHPSWAAIGATAVMQGGHLHVTMHRAVQRMAGTLFGVVLVWLILSMEPPFWLIVGAIVVFQFITEVIIGFNYALGQITITPMAAHDLSCLAGRHSSRNVSGAGGRHHARCGDRHHLRGDVFHHGRPPPSGTAASHSKIDGAVLHAARWPHRPGGDARCTGLKDRSTRHE